MLIDGLHAVVFTSRNQRLKLLRTWCFQNRIMNARRTHHKFERSYPATSIFTIDQSLTNNALQHSSEDVTNLVVLMWGEKVNDATHRFDGVDGRKCADY